MVCKGAERPLILQPTHVSPSLEWTAKAKSIGVALFGIVITSPFGVKQNT